MEVPPRDPKSHIMNRKFVSHFVSLGFLMGIIVIATYLVDLMSHGWKWGDSIETTSETYLHASTMAFVTLVLIQVVNAFNARSAKQSIFKLKSNFYLWAAAFISTMMVVLMVNLEWLREKLEITQLSLRDWLVVVLVSLTVLVFEEGRKFVNTRQKKPAIT